MNRTRFNKENSFQQFVLDQLRCMPGLTCRGMFGGYGLYQNGQFFGIIHKGRLYLKTHVGTKAQYVQQGMKPFRPNRNQMLKNYYEVPVEIIEDSESLLTWALNAAEVKKGSHPSSGPPVQKNKSSNF